MAFLSKPPCLLHGQYSNPIALCSSLVILSSPSTPTTSFNFRVLALKTGSDGSELLRKPILVSENEDLEEHGEGNRKGKRISHKVKKEDEEWVDWEDQILEETVPLVGFARMILHSGKYENGDKLSAEHERTIKERLLPYHPEYEKKIGDGIDHITVGHHPEFESSRCMFIVRKDGKLVDFSYWKCIKGLIRKNYPLYADSFILRHFRTRRHSQ